MIDARRIDGKAKYGTQYTMGNITLYVTTEFWGGRWHEPTILLNIEAENAPPSMRHLIRDRVTEITYEACIDLEAVFGKASRESLELDEWRVAKNYQKSSDSV